MPFEGPPSRVCRCGSDWGDLTELIRLLDELLSDPPPADAAVLPPGLPDPTKITPEIEEIPDHA
jgi:hypothetical protein